MSLAKFRDEPWKQSHPAYSSSLFSMTPAPEYASSEVLLSSLYRVIGFQGASERTVPAQGRELDREIQKLRDRSKLTSGAALDPDAFHTMLHSVLESPKLPNQSSRRFLQVTPLVPQTAVFSGSARLGGNPWTAGTLIRRMVQLGSKDQGEAQAVWLSLFDALSVSDDDDIFARFLQDEVQAWTANSQWTFVGFEGSSHFLSEDRTNLSYPARRFVRDLLSIIEAKNSMTRRQWTSLLESIIRLAAVSHVIWLCDVQARVWDCVRAAMEGGGPTSATQARQMIFPRSLSYLSYGDRALAGLTDRVAGFLKARLGLNALLWAAQELSPETSPSLDSAEGVADFCALTRKLGPTFTSLDLKATLSEINERETRALLCKKGIGSNIMEFARHALGQRHTASPILRGYDQGFIIRKRGTSPASPWIVGLGPVAVLALVHCSLAETTGPRSVHRLAQHLSMYGILVDHRDIAQNDLGQQLRMLGLVLDSPDAESGMLLVPPFERQEA